MKSDFLLAFNQICNERGLSSEVVLEALQMALVSAYRRDTDANPAQNITAKIDLETGKARIFVERTVVEDVQDTEMEISLAEARTIRSDAQLDETVMVEDTPKDFGRIAAQSAKQIILQRIREAERDARYAHYVQQEGEIVHGTVQNITPRVVTVNLEGTEAILPRSQQVPGERYTLHQRLRAYVLEVHKTGRGPQITISRSHKDMLRRLLELEVPEIFSGAVEIKSIAREAGSRSKVAVAARQPGVDPVGACVGMRGVRIQSIVNELGGEKIDIIEWDPNPASFIAKALSPAKVLSVLLEEEPVNGKTANVVVPDDQLSLAIGRSGQNARLSAKLTGWRIDIQGVTEAATAALAQINEDPNLLPALGPVAELLPSVAAALRQHEQESLPYTSEELLSMRQVIQGVRNYYESLRNAERARMLEEEMARRAAIQSAKEERQATIESARSRIPPAAYEVPLDEFGLSTRVFGHLERAELENVGEVMELLAEGDEGLLKLDGIGPKSLAEVKECIAAMDLQPAEEAVADETVEAQAIEPEPEPEVAEAVEAAVEIEAEPEPEPEIEEAEAVVLTAEPEEVPAEPVGPVFEDQEEAEPVAVEELAEEEAEEPAVVTEVAAEAVEEPAEEVERIEELVPEAGEFAFDDDEDEFEDDESSRKRDRRRRRRLVYDEELGEVVSRRRYKRETDDWEQYM